MAKPKTKKNLYDIEYNKKFIKVKHVMFNTNFPEDMELMEWLDTKPSKSAFIKELLRAEKAREQGV